MIKTSLRERVSEELLPCVRQPGQYIGHEWNQLVQPGDWSASEVRIAIGFPDAYTIGMSHLGCQILYWLCNHTPGVCAERVYAPWIDAEQVMREKGIPLFTWDTRQPVAEADIFAISLQYEMGFTNILTMLELAGIPFDSGQRNESHPLVIAGGPQADNPEPIADFFDLVVIGDGEHSMAAVINAYRGLKRAGAKRREMILEMARRFEWIYAPLLYRFEYNADGTIARMDPSDLCPPGFPLRQYISRCKTPDFEGAAFPTKPLVPYVETVHDRIAIEVMRGCPQACRFCHAGFTKRPVVWRSVDRILEIAEEAWQATGYNEIGLLSLSTADYPKLRDLAERANNRFRERHVNLSLPSLRVDKMLANIPWMANSVRKSGLTIAAEAALDDMRAAIHKKVTDGDLLDGVRQAYEAGWKNVKLYFMAGFPGEREEDIDGIVDLACEVSQLKRKVSGGPASVRAAVSWFVPKPHTPMQWAAQRDAEYFQEVRDRLKRAMIGRRLPVRIETHTPERSLLEGAFARGDRRLAPVIRTAHKLGARMDGWDECFDHHLWMRAFDETGIDPAWYANRARDVSEILPWNHIAGGVAGDVIQRWYEDLFAKLRVGQVRARTTV
jgi:radical SAM family uncharacterized protein